ncbi:hypothetical protein EMCRGX_G020827 [Ephydatia muelleri]
MVDTAASGEGLGAVLSQVVDGHECVVSYASRVLSRSERKYCATHREMLALVWAVHIFRLYLYGKRFTLRMDHSCLKWLHNFKEPEGQVARWLETWAEFDYEVVHRPGHLGVRKTLEKIQHRFYWPGQRKDVDMWCEYTSPEQYSHILVERGYKLVRDHVEKKQRHQKDIFDRKVDNEDSQSQQHVSTEIPKTSSKRPPELHNGNDEEGEFIYSDIEELNTDAAPAPAPAEQLRGREQEPNDLLQEIPHAMQPEVVPIPASPLRRSGRRTQPSTRYGQPLIVPDSIPENIAVGSVRTHS